MRAAGHAVCLPEDIDTDVVIAGQVPSDQGQEPLGIPCF